MDTKRDFEGYDQNGKNAFGFDYAGFNADGIHELTGTPYNPQGLDVNGRDQSGYCPEKHSCNCDIETINKEELEVLG